MLTYLSQLLTKTFWKINWWALFAKAFFEGKVTQNMILGVKAFANYCSHDYYKEEKKNSRSYQTSIIEVFSKNSIKYSPKEVST